MSNPEAFANSLEPQLPEENLVGSGADSTDGTFPTDTEQPESQGEDPLAAELGDAGQGDSSPEE